MNGKLKSAFFVCLFIFQGLLLSAQDGANIRIQPLPKSNWTWVMTGEPESPPPKGPILPFKNRTFEVSTQASVYASNVFAAGDLFQSPFSILGNIIDAGGFSNDPSFYSRDNTPFNIEDIFKGFRANLGGDIAPLSININIRDRWGFGFDIGHTSFTGNVFLPEVILNDINEIISDPAKAPDGTLDVGAAVFMDFAIPVFFHVGDFKVKVRPAAYVPLLYMRPEIRYGFKKDQNDPGRFELFSYKMRIFSPFSLEWMLGDGDFDTGNMSNIGGSLGYDISFGVEYPIYSWLSAGVDIVNFPFMPARPEHYAQLSGSASLDFDPAILPGGNVGIGDGELEADMKDPVFGTNSDKTIFRPFSILTYANYRPFNERIVTIIPSFGFSVNRLYVNPVALEGGLSARIDLENVLATTVGINYNDRMWRNSLDFMLNLRAVQLDFGVSWQAHDFVQSFKGTGPGFNVGLKMGW